MFTYINQMRIIHSIRDIQNTTYSLTRIAIQNGFYSLEYFSETFHKYMGVSPRVYQMYWNYRFQVNETNLQIISEHWAELQAFANFIREYKKNKEIASKLKSLQGSNANSDGNDAMTMQIKNLKNELAVANANANEQIKLLRSSNRLQKDAGKSEAENLKKELEELQKQQGELVQIAKENWVVGSVNVHDGEKVSSFAPIITLTHKSPTLVRGYIHERMYQRMDIGETVKVKTLSGTGKPVKGKVVGLSSRIVEFPVRMWKMPEMPIHGREVIITIPAENPFLLGEMVTISE